MKKIVSFYLLCCLSIILTWLITEKYDIESKDFKFGFNFLLLVTCAIYAPIFTIFAFILNYSKVNRAILSNKWLTILYCVFPFLFYKILYILCIYSGIKIDYRLEYSIPVVFIVQNIIIIIRYIRYRGLR